MNPVVLGALVGAVPGTVAAGLTTWSAGRSARASLAADYNRWLREKRADTYVDMLKFPRTSQMRRSVLETPQEITEQKVRELKQMYQIFEADETTGLWARASAYAAPGTAQAFRHSWETERDVWYLTRDRLDSKIPEITANLGQAIRRANDAISHFDKKAHDDLQELT
jgi:gas vesicle protein